MRHVVTTKVSLRVTTGGHEVRIPMLGLVWQKSMCAVAANVQEDCKVRLHYISCHVCHVYFVSHVCRVCTISEKSARPGDF